MARNSNVAMKQPPVVIKKTEFKITPDMHKDYIDHAGELRVWKDRLQRDIADGKSADVINETKRRLFAVEHHIDQKYVPLEDVTDVIKKTPPLELSDDELRSAFIDVDKAQAVNVQILSSMEQLSEFLTRMV